MDRVLQENRCNCPERVCGQCRLLGLSTGWDHPTIGAIPTCAISPMRAEALPWCQVDAEVGAGPSTPYEDVAQAIEDLLARRYEFPIRLALLTAQDYAAELRNLPDWWHGEVARRDALFYTRGLDSAHVRERIEAMELGDEAVHFGQHAVFWAKFDEKTFLKTAYHKRLLREDFYRQVTIRSGSTVGKIAAMLSRG